jgi:hypothetical protein
MREHPLSYPAPNTAIHAVRGVAPDEHDVTGNVLVVKRLQRKRDMIIDCTEDDIYWTNHIIKR